MTPRQRPNTDHTHRCKRRSRLKRSACIRYMFLLTHQSRTSAQVTRVKSIPSRPGRIRNPSKEERSRYRQRSSATTDETQVEKLFRDVEKSGSFVGAFVGCSHSFQSSVF